MVSSKVAWNKDRGTPLCLLSVYSLIFFSIISRFVIVSFDGTGRE